ncbi:MAG: hypothetical protein LC808_32570 [Actinobacteria bacterium]|nr:hypothetical protein [Actinomycetota bacterium]
MNDVALVPLAGPSLEGVLIEAIVVDPEQDVAIAALDFDRVLHAINGLARSFAHVLADVSPSKATIEFGVTAGIESGSLVAILGKASASSTIKLTLEWER